MTLKLITAEGSPFDFGNQIGTAVRETVHQISIHNEEFRAAEDKWMGSSYVDQMIQRTTKAFPDLIQELQGLAQGMQIDFERAFLWNCRGDLRWPDNISAKMAAELSEGCTSLLLPKSNSGKSVVAHNEDGSADYNGHCFWLQASPENGPQFESFLYPGMIAGHSMGANAAGIIQTINNIRVHDLKIGIPRHFICRAILACWNMEQVFALLKRTDRASGFHHNLADATTRQLYSVEAPASGTVIREVAGTPSAHANHLIYPEFEAIPQSITTSSKVRQIRADELLHASTNAAPDPKQILLESKSGFEILRQPNDRGDDYGQTLASGIFSIQDTTIDIELLHGNSAHPFMKRQIAIQKLRS
jgi:hypothetical protein